MIIAIFNDTIERNNSLKRLALALFLLCSFSTDVLSSNSQISEWQKTVDQLKEIIIVEPENHETLFLLGFAYNQLHDFKNGEKYLKTALSFDPDNQEINREYGIALAGLGQYQNALKYIQKANVNHPRTTKALLGIKYLLASKTSPAKPFSFELSFGAYHDSNVILYPDNDGQPSSFQKPVKDSMAISFGLNTRYVPDTDWLQSIYLDLSHIEYPGISNYDQNGIHLGLSTNLSDNINIQVQNKFDITNSEFRSYILSIPISVKFPVSDDLILTGRFTPEYNFQFYNPQLEAEDGSGPGYQLGLFANQKLFNDKAWLTLGVTYDITTPHGKSMEYKALGLNAAALIKINKQIDFSIGIIFREPKYKNGNVRSTTNVKRKDSFFNVYSAIKYSYKIGKLAQSLELFYSYINNDSNIPTYYEYKQNKVGLVLRILL